MPSEINNALATHFDQLQAILDKYADPAAATAPRSAPLPPGQAPDAAPRKGLPSLPAPAGPISLDVLLKALGDDVRKASIRGGVEGIKARGAEQARAGRKQLESIKKQIDAIEKQKNLSFWAKAFSLISTIIGAIASAATLVGGIMTGNPVLIGMGAVALAMTLDSVLAIATDGKISLSAGLSKMFQAMGMSENTAGWVAFAVQMVIVAVTTGVAIAASLGKIGGKAAAKVGEQAAREMREAAGEVAEQMVKRLPKSFSYTLSGLEMATAGTDLGGTGMNVAAAYAENEASSAAAAQKKLQALLERIREAIAAEKALVEAEVHRASALTEKVMDIIRSSNSAQTAILTANPSMA